ncbi:MAG: insulinase family protein [Gammaproteobacteria bacterium]
MNQFDQIQQSYLPTLQADFQLYVDKRTGAHHIHLANEDTNNAFMVAFPTRPTDSTGVAHILEHTTLCGSESYPVRDPFFMMLRRSLNTFMNAFTSSDCTAYPFATQNQKDFHNLLSVYVDAVFFPILDPLDFDQEGWRLDFGNNGSELVYKGVVYNEMKGAMSSPVSQLWQHLSASLFPDTIYANHSGGDPLEITNLAYDELRKFHRRYYHPTHAVFMTYGSFDVDDHQRLISERVLCKFEQQAPLEPLPLQNAFAHPASLRTPYEIGAEESTERKTHALWAWVFGKTASPSDSLEAQFLSAILLDNSASPLRYLLETTNLADAPSELCGLDDSAQQIVFAAGVEGSDEESIAELDEQIFAVLEKISNEGVEPEIVDGIIDGIEMAQRDIGSDSYPYGLQLMSRMLPAIIYGAEPQALLALDEEIETLRKKCEAPDYVRKLIQRHLLQNPHRTCITMFPDPDKMKRDRAQEQQKLQALQRAMSSTAKTELLQRIKALGERQKTDDDVDVLPRVTLADVPHQIIKLEGTSNDINGIPFHFYDRPTNGLFYCNIIYDLSRLSAQELTLLPFFTEFMLELGSESDSYTTVQQRRSRLGVFGSYSSARNQVSNIETLNGRLVVSTKCLARKTSAALSEVATILSGLRFDETQRLRDLIVQERVDAEASIIDRGHEIAMAGAATGLTPSATLDDYWQGPLNILEAQKLEKRVAQDAAIEELVVIFTNIRDKLLSQACQVLCIGETRTLNEVTNFADEISFGPSVSDKNMLAGTRQLENLPALVQPNAWLTASQINFCGRAHRVVAPGDVAVPALLVLSKYLQDGFLHPAIREAGGAYGSGAHYDAESSSFRFFSYRDPRLGETFKDFERSLDWLAENKESARLEESILGVIRQLDKPKTPAGAALGAFYDELDNVGYDFRTTLRDRVLDTSYEQLVAVAERFLRTDGQLSLVTDRANEAAVKELGMNPAKLS